MSLRLVAMLALTVLLNACSEEQGPPLPKIGGVFPELQLHSLSGENVNSSQLFADKVVVFNVWATWCPPCRKEMPDLIHLSRILPEEKFLVVGLATDSNEEDVQAYIREHGISFPVFRDRDGTTIAGPKLGVYKYPETFVLNRNGKVMEKVLGAFPWADPEMVKILNYIYTTGHVPEWGTGAQ